MDTTHWYKQGSKPIFDELLWSKPENKRFAGKLLIIGGNAHGMLAPANAFSLASKTGIGQTKVLLPDVLAKTVGATLDNTHYGATNKSGSFAKNALNDWLDYSGWADCVLLAGDFGRNSETAIALERFMKLSNAQIVITHDAIDELYNVAAAVLERPQTTLVASLGQLQKLTAEAKYPQPLKYEFTIQQMVDLLQHLTTKFPVNIILRHNDVYVCASNGQVSTTSSPKEQGIWRIETAAIASVWLAQNPTKNFEALTTAIYELTQQEAK